MLSGWLELAKIMSPFEVAGVIMMRFVDFRTIPLCDHVRTYQIDNNQPRSILQN